MKRVFPVDWKMEEGFGACQNNKRQLVDWRNDQRATDAAWMLVNTGPREVDIPLRRSSRGEPMRSHAIGECRRKSSDAQQ